MVTLEPDNPRGIVLFGAGAGGDPARYRALLESFARSGLVVLAPHCERFNPRTVTTEQMVARPTSMLTALAQRTHDGLPVTAVGHSVGGWAALCLAGAIAWGHDGQPVPVPHEPTISRLVLFAPTVGWFHAPGALAAVRAPMRVFVGTEDTVTPPHTAGVLRQAPAEVDVQVCPHVGHFDFMDTPPPGTASHPQLDRAAFLKDLAVRTTAFAAASSSGIERTSRLPAQPALD